MADHLYFFVAAISLLPNEEEENKHSLLGNDLKTSIYITCTNVTTTKNDTRTKIYFLLLCFG